MRRKLGKKIDTWGFRENGQNFEAEVRLLDVGGRAEFQAEVEEHDICLRDSDLNALREKVRKEIRAATAITWENYLRFTVELDPVPEIDSEDFNYFSGRRDFVLRVEPLQVAKTEDGKVVWRKPNSGSIQSYSPFDGNEEGVYLMPDSAELRRQFVTLVNGLTATLGDVNQFFNDAQRSDLTKKIDKKGRL